MKANKKHRRLELDSPKRLTAGLVHHRWPVIAADGERLAYAAGDGADSTWVLTDRKGRVARTFEGPADSGACFGADGSFAFSRRLGATSEIWIAPAPSSPAVRLLGGDGKIYREPALSPDGRTLAFACGDDPSGRTSVWLLDVPTGQRRMLPSDGRSDGRPSFGPTGDLYFDGAQNGRVAVYRYHPESDVAVRISPDDGSYRRPAALGNGLVLVEKHLDGVVRLVVLDDVSGQELRLDEMGELRDPAVARRKQRPFVLYAALSDPSDGEPRRFDIYMAKLRGLPRQRIESAPVTPEAAAGGATETEAQP